MSLTDDTTDSSSTVNAPRSHSCRHGLLKSIVKFRFKVHYRRAIIPLLSTSLVLAAIYPTVSKIVCVIRGKGVHTCLFSLSPPSAKLSLSLTWKAWIVRIEIPKFFKRLCSNIKKLRLILTVTSSSRLGPRLL